MELGGEGRRGGGLQEGDSPFSASRAKELLGNPAGKYIYIYVVPLGWLPQVSEDE